MLASPLLDILDWESQRLWRGGGGLGLLGGRGGEGGGGGVSLSYGPVAVPVCQPGPQWTQAQSLRLACQCGTGVEFLSMYRVQLGVRARSTVTCCSLLRVRVTSRPGPGPGSSHGQARRLLGTRNRYLEVTQPKLKVRSRPLQISELPVPREWQPLVPVGRDSESPRWGCW